MAIVFEKGDLFAVEADVIGHGANCRGLMGAGIAKAFAAKFPEMLREYERDCILGKYVPGDFQTWVENDTVGVNLFTQDEPGPNAEWEAIVASLMGVSQRMKRSYAHLPIVFAIPLIGCGIGGLEFEDLHEAVQLVESIFPMITYKIVYNDDNENQIPSDFRDGTL